MSDKIVLCRRDNAEIGEPKNYCGKPINTKSNLNWCDEHLARVPYWPQ